MTVLQAVQEAFKQVGHLDKLDIITQLLRNGYNVKPAANVFRAIDTIETGKEHPTNKKRAGKIRLDGDKEIEIEKEEYQEIKKRLVIRYYDLKSKGLCVSCGKMPGHEGRKHCKKCWKKQGDDRRRKSTGYVMEGKYE